MKNTYKVMELSLILDTTDKDKQEWNATVRLKDLDQSHKYGLIKCLTQLVDDLVERAD